MWPDTNCKDWWSSALGLGLTSGSLWLVAQFSPHPGRLLELTALVFANLLATVLRFVLMREWVFARRTRESEVSA